jgi:iron complex outermembrane receptor protein
MLSVSPASAQRAAENVVRQADDAFGSSVGDERIGLYSPGNVRGFSPTAAGNVRVEGLFIDRQTDFSTRLVDSSTIRAGLTAQGYLLPAPTGIADFSLRRVAEEPIQSAILELKEYGGYGFAADLQARSRNGVLEATGGVGYDHRNFGNGTTDISASAGGTLRLQPGPALDLTLFADYIAILQDEVSPRYFPAGTFLPPQVVRRRFVGQPWVKYQGDRYNVGLLADYRTSVADLRLGVFRSHRDADTQTGQFFTEVQRDGTTQRLAFLGPPSDATSDSLEARASRRIDEGRRQHDITLSLRLRERLRRFGGNVEIDLGEGNVDVPDFVERPDVAFGERSREEVRQVTGGLAYDLQWADVGQLNLGLQQTDYRRRLEDPANGPAATEASPLLYNATASGALRSWLVAYGGVVTGFEESPVAPSIAVNRNEAQPAIETRQADAGVRLLIGRLTAVAGVFRIEKPFFGLDADRVFGERGVVTNRGVELSLAGAATRELQLVVGTLLLDASLSGQAVEDGELSKDPIGALRRTTTLNLDYRPEWAPDWSFDISVTSRGEENADEGGELRVPPRTLLDLGLRRQFTAGTAQLVIRARLINVFDAFGWNVSSNGAFNFIGPRAFAVSLRMDL